MKFRKKPVEIEAIQFSEDTIPNDIALWCGGVARSVDYGAYEIVIETLEGEMTAQEGDWIIRGVKGEYYPCKPDIFDLTYDAVEDE